MKSTLRIDSLDTLRGFAILTMSLSGLLPFYINTLPDWMYHGQLPPPTHKFNPGVPGITWVDLVFPMFLFAMGAAIPLALSKLTGQKKNISIFYTILKRSLSLAFFAIVLQHFKPYTLNPDPGFGTWILALSGMVLLCLLFLRFKNGGRYSDIIKTSTVSLLVLVLFFLKYPDGSGFDFYRSDIIILILSNVYFFGAIIWLLTRKEIIIRVGFIGFILALRLSHEFAAWTEWIWNISPFPWLFKVYYLQYLVLVIPGTIAGDYLLEKYDNFPKKSYSLVYQFMYSLIYLSLVVISLALLKMRETHFLLIFAIVLAGIVFALRKRNLCPLIPQIRKIIPLGFSLFFIGLFLEPFEGGIRKDSATISYYFVTGGLSIFSLAFFSAMIDNLKQNKFFNVLILNGQNPVFAYAAISNLMYPLLGLTGLDIVFSKMVISPWLGFLKGLIITVALAFIVAFATRRHFILRA